ncbi:MAG TPA: hypothetical protein VMJ73_09900 [Rhizomicrobium sp.]|nr:hypothetical protein [Rhizomicrobium sp.]
MRNLIAVLFGLIVLCSPARANCTCACINGKVEPLCTSTLEVKPYCAPTICPAPPAANPPASLATIPPPGTSSCKLDQYWNAITNHYEWRRVCR